MYFVYIIYSTALDRYYVGYSSNVELRLQRHKAKSIGYTGRATDWVICYTQQFTTKTEAIVREKEIKNWKSRRLIEKLIRQK